VTVEAGGGDGLGEDDADGNEDGAGAGSEGHGDFHAGALGVLVATAKAEAAFGQILADGDFFLKAAAANASENAGLDARAVAAGNDALFDGRLAGAVFGSANLGLGFDPDGGRVTMAAHARDAFANFEGFQLKLVEINDFAALAKTAFHEQAGEGFLGFVGRREINVPKVRAWFEKMNGVDKAFEILIDFGDDARAGIFPVIALEAAAEMKLLAGIELLVDAQDATIAADQQRFGGLREGGAGGRGPGSFHGHAEADAVTLPEAVGFSRHKGDAKKAHCQASTQRRGGQGGETGICRSK
jgi:hypothetical protein